MIRRAIVASVILLPLTAAAHIHLVTPMSRTDLLTGDQKDQHCGVANQVRNPARVTTYKPGETITVTWMETIQHPGHFRIAFQPNGSEFGIPPAGNGPPAGFPSVDQTGMTNATNGSIVLKDMIPDGMTSTQVTLPNMECNNCTLQFIQVMTDKSPYTIDAASDDVYFNCADLTLSNTTPPPGPDAGVPPGPDAGSTDPGSTSGGCSSSDASGSLWLPLGLAAVALAARRRRAGLAMLACLVAWSRPAAAEEMRIATLAPSGTPWMESLEKAASEISAKTDKRVTVKYYPGGQQGDERDFVRKIRLGQLDGAAVTAMGLAMIDPSILVLQLPMLFADEDEVDYVAGKMWPHFQKKFAKQGFRLGERGEVGWVYFFSKSKVTTMDDLRKQKLWVMGDANMSDNFLDRMKLSGVPLGIAEVDAALASGRITATFSSPLGAIALQWYSKVRFMNSIPLTFAIGATIYSLEAQKRISATDQADIEALGKRNQKKARAVIRKANEEAKKTIIKKGIQIVEPSKDMVDELTAAAAAVQSAMIGKVYSQEELDMVLKYRAEYRAKNAKPAAAAAATPAPAAK